MKTAVETCGLCCACDSAEGLVDVVVPWVDCEISYRVLEGRQPEMVRIERVSCLGEGHAGVIATCDENVVRGSDAVIGDADFASPLGSDPRSVVARYRSTCRIEKPCATAVSASAHVNIGQCEACYVDVVESVPVQG